MDARLMRSSARLLLMAVLLAACQPTTAEDKAGNVTAALRLATIDGAGSNWPGPQAFIDGLSAVSDGAFIVEVQQTYGEGVADAESQLVTAIASGELDGGWPSTRAFADADITGLEVVEAPMTISSYEAQRALVSGPVADRLLANLEGSGIVGLGLAVGPLRRPFAADRPLLEPADWEGVRFRVYNSPVQADAIDALGGTPANLGLDWIHEIQRGALGGVEFDVGQYAHNGLSTEAGHITGNVVLWPKVFVLSFSQARWESFSEQQRQWVREAAEQAVTASVEASNEEDTATSELCERGGRIALATSEQIAALRAELQPVVDGLAAAEPAGALLADIQAIAEEHPGPDVPAVPDGCLEEADAPDQGDAAAGDAEGGIPAEVSAVPDGVYRVEITTQAVEDAGLDNRGGTSGTWTLTIEDGTYELRCSPIEDPGVDCGGAVSEDALEGGPVRGTGDSVHFVFAPGQSREVGWEVDGDTLEFSERSPVGFAYELVLLPWSRIG